MQYWSNFYIHVIYFARRLIYPAADSVGPSHSRAPPARGIAFSRIATDLFSRSRYIGNLRALNSTCESGSAFAIDAWFISSIEIDVGRCSDSNEAVMPDTCTRSRCINRSVGRKCHFAKRNLCNLEGSLGCFWYFSWLRNRRKIAQQDSVSIVSSFYY